MKTSSRGPRFTPSKLEPALTHIDQTWTRLERYHPHDEATLIGLPYPYFVPSSGTTDGFTFDEMYYWDSYFIARGLIGTHRQHLVKGITEDMMSLMDRFGVVPNGSRSYFTSRSQPPFLTSMILETHRLYGDKKWLRRAIDVAKNEYRTVWMGTAQPNWRQVFNGLSRYYDINVLDDLAEAESGWDMTTRFNRQALSYIPVDLNALLYKYETDFAAVATMLGDGEEADEWRKRALARKTMMRKYLWDDEQGFYFDYNYLTGKRSDVWSLAGFYPMWAGMDDNDDAARIAGNLHRFEADGGVTTTALQKLAPNTFPVQWSHPNGWAPLQLLVTEGLEHYGYHAEAERIARKWLKTNLDLFTRDGVFYEKYNVVTPGAPPREGVYPSQVGFGWTNGVFTALAQRYLTSEELPVAIAQPWQRGRGAMWRGVGVLNLGNLRGLKVVGRRPTKTP